MRRTSTTKRALSRRTVLRGMGGVAVALPFLESLHEARAGTDKILRYLQFMHVEGTLVNEWAPSGPADAMVLSSILDPSLLILKIPTSAVLAT